MPRINPRLALLAGAVLAALVAPLALAAGEGGPLDGGARNPSANQSLAYNAETEIIANTGSYGTRQSNKSDNGGGAIYGCRSRPGGTPSRNEPCIRSNNLAAGLAFEFETNGTVAGTIVAGRGGDTTRPFTTNATGVATGLNADEVDGRSADDLLAKDGKAADADKLDGRDSASFASASDLAFATVDADGDVTRARGATGATLVAATDTFTVTFDRDVSKCSFTVTQAAAAADADVAFAATATSGDVRSVTVDQDDTGDPVPFHLQVVC